MAPKLKTRAAASPHPDDEAELRSALRETPIDVHDAEAFAKWLESGGDEDEWRGRSK